MPKYSSFNLQKCPSYLFVLLEWFVRREVGGHTAAILSSLASRICFKLHVAFLYSSYPAISTCLSVASVCYSHTVDTALKKSRFFYQRYDFYEIDNLPIVAQAFARRMLTILSVDEILLSRHVNLSTNFRGLLMKVEMSLHSRSGQCLSLLTASYAAEIRLRKVYLWEMLECLHIS